SCSALSTHSFILSQLLGKLFLCRSKCPQFEKGPGWYRYFNPAFLVRAMASSIVDVPKSWIRYAEVASPERLLHTPPILGWGHPSLSSMASKVFTTSSGGHPNRPLFEPRLPSSWYAGAS